MRPVPTARAGGGMIRTMPSWNNVIPKKPAFPLSDEQLRIVDAIVRGVQHGKSIQTLGGYAGTGKTATIRELRARLPGMTVCAFTGKAATMLHGLSRRGPLVRYRDPDVVARQIILYQPNPPAFSQTSGRM